MTDHWSTDTAGAAHYAAESGLPEVRMTRAEAEADAAAEPRSVHAGRFMCPRGCRTSFVSAQSIACVEHMRIVHGERPPPGMAIDRGGR